MLETETAVAQQIEPAESAFSPAKELRDAFWDLKKSRIRISPAHTSRASSIGEHCERKLFYFRTAGEMATPHGPELQAIFDLGNGLERYVIRELEALGADIVQREKDYLDRERELSARIDCRIRMPSWPEAYTAEIKGLNPYTAESIDEIMDIRESRQAWVKKYYDQLQTYIHFENATLGVFVLLNKVSGEIEFVDCPRDEARIAEILAKAERIRDAVRANEPPPRNDGEDCKRCPFLHVCLPDRTFGPGVQILDSEELEALIARKLELADAKSEAEAIDKQLKKMLPEVPELLVGNYVVTAKKIHRDGYPVKPTDFWQRKYAPLVKGETH
jgi:CRISPR/Cas system-associated exonuclease Cas4 (RecB family)